MNRTRSLASRLHSRAQQTWQSAKEAGPLWTLAEQLDRVFPTNRLPLRWKDRVVTAEALARQLASVLRTWGMCEEHTSITVDSMLYADLRGIDGHGVGMLPAYEAWYRDGLLEMKPEIELVRDDETTALLDGGRGLGHPTAHRAMTLAIEKCRRSGMGAVAVRNSAHFGAAGAYTSMAAQAGLIGWATTSTRAPAMVPTFGTEAVLGTNALSVAAPASWNPPLVLDMATTTVAWGKITSARRRGRRIPRGWAVDARGRPLRDPARAAREGVLLPLGGSRETGGHKGYGLGVVVEMLSTVLSGGVYAKTRAERRPEATGLQVGHFFLALDPARFRPEGDFETDLDHLLDTLRASAPSDPAQPVRVAGDPEREALEARSRAGIPLARPLFEEIRRTARAAGVPFLLDGAE